MASRLMEASSSLCPPLRNTTPATAGGTVRCSACTVAPAISAVLAGFASMPARAAMANYIWTMTMAQDSVLSGPDAELFSDVTQMAV